MNYRSGLSQLSSKWRLLFRGYTGRGDRSQEGDRADPHAPQLKMSQMSSAQRQDSLGRHRLRSELVDLNNLPQVRPHLQVRDFVPFWVSACRKLVLDRQPCVVPVGPICFLRERRSFCFVSPLDRQQTLVKPVKICPSISSTLRRSAKVNQMCLVGVSPLGEQGLGTGRT